jgi:hypothetical protein
LHSLTSAQQTNPINQFTNPKTTTAIMSKSRVPLAIGLAGAGGIGYYLFSAGGNPKAAEKKFEGELLF